ncbi:MFS transporter [Hamadaea tsunoensis]|uniref:MFS transporter n=1 Tax=Hamadaea tsunoensis TaxID=53368 RepID=UPI000683EB1D|nr:MFS transporter [Hamadaea tsunoensis]
MTLLETRAAPAAYRHRWIGLVALLAAEAANLLDATIAQIVAPVIHADLGGPLSSVKWVTSAYTLPFALLLLPGGRLGDIVGRRRVFLGGVVAFAAASLACALAPTMGLLLAARAVQGAAAAAIVPQTVGLIKAMFRGREVTRALGTIGPVMGLAAISGPILGGVLAHAWSWRAAFLVNLPVCLAVLLLARPLPQDRAPDRPRWYSLLEVSLLRRPAFPAALVTCGLLFALTTGLTLVVVLHAQLAAGADTIGAALTLLPWTLGMAAASLAAGGRLLSARPRRTLLGSLALVLCGITIAVYAYRQHPAVLPYALAVIGVGAGLFTPSFFTTALSDLDAQQIGSASGLLNAVQQLGATVGTMVLGGMYLRDPATVDPAFAVAASFVLGTALTTAVMVRRPAPVASKAPWT